MKFRNYFILSGMFSLLCLYTPAQAAQQAWIKDDLRTGVQKDPSRDADFVGTLIAGMPVERLETSKDGQYTHIRTKDLTGWVLARNVIDTPSIRARFETQEKALQQAQAQLSDIKHNDQVADTENTQLRQALAKVQAEAKKAHDDLLSLQRASENVVEIDALNRKLQDRVVSLEQANLALTQQNTRLSERSQHRQMVIGGILVLGGMILFWLLSLMSHTRRRSSFNDF